MVKHKYIDQEDEFFVDGEKSRVLSKQENELFNEANYIVHDIINVKRVVLPKNGEDWEITKNKQLVLTIKGVRFSKKEREFLRKQEGFIFLMNGFKAGWKNISEFKRNIK